MQPQFERKEAPKRMTGKLTKVWLVINSLIARKFTGYIKLNFSQGAIGKIEKFEEIPME